ncbi:hypothetical protein KR222_002156, partial [Zaprionus bogoriensis]
MSIKAIFTYLIFSYVTISFSSTRGTTCCSPEPILNKMRALNSSNFDHCSHMANDLGAIGLPDSKDSSDRIESPVGYGLKSREEFHSDINHTLPNCARKKVLNISDFSVPSVAVSEKSCLFMLNSNLIALACHSSNNDTLREIGFINKCCPKNYTYKSGVNKCFEGEPNFDIYSNIFDKPTLFLNTFGCPSSKVIVEYVETAATIYLKENQLVWRDESRVLSRNDYCIEAINEISSDSSVPQLNQNQRFLIRSCQPAQVCESLPCLRKCCGDGEIYFKNNVTTYCDKAENDLNFQSVTSWSITGNFTKPSEFGILSGLDCPKFRLDPDSFADEAHTISSINGSLVITSTKKMYSNKQYCIEKIKTASMLDQKFYTFLCFDSKVVSNDRIRFRMYPIGLLISCCFYAITLVVYVSIKKLRNLPGKILICLVSSLLFAYLGIALGQLMPTSNNNICFISGFVVYFFLMAAFSWMNVTCFDIWKTFGSTKSKNMQSREERSRFLIYSIYGWGFPIVLTTITVTLSKSDVLLENFRPNFGNGRCWFTYDTIGYASLIFFSGPLGILFIINLALFSLTLKYCNKVKREIFRMQSSNTEKPALRTRFFMDKTRFIMNTKLCFVMGITWLLEIASIMFYDHKKNFFWAISDSFNVLLGVFVFFIFVFKRRVWNEIKHKLG